MPGVFYHKEKDLIACGHIDDVIRRGSSENLRWLQDMIAQEFEFKATVIGPDEFDKKEATFLGRRLTWISNGIYWEADEKHAMEWLREYRLMECNSVSTPLSNETDKNLGQREDRELMGVQEAGRQRFVRPPELLGARSARPSCYRMLPCENHGDTPPR